MAELLLSLECPFTVIRHIALRIFGKAVASRRDQSLDRCHILVYRAGCDAPMLTYNKYPEAKEVPVRWMPHGRSRSPGAQLGTWRSLRSSQSSLLRTPIARVQELSPSNKKKSLCLTEHLSVTHTHTEKCFISVLFRYILIPRDEQRHPG